MKGGFNLSFLFSSEVKVLIIETDRKQWLTSGLIKSIQMKSNYFKLLELSLITDDKNTNYENRLSSLIRTAKRRYCQDLQ